MKRQKPCLTEKHAFEVQLALEKHVLPGLGNLPIEKNQKPEVRICKTKESLKLLIVVANESVLKER